MPNQIYTTKFEGSRRTNSLLVKTGSIKPLSMLMGGAIQEVYHIIFFISIAFILHFVKSKYRCDNIRKNGEYLR